jgi:tetratricopeptide (TPR) repeat protein
MSRRTLVVVLILVAAGVGGWVWWARREPVPPVPEVDVTGADPAVAAAVTAARESVRKTPRSAETWGRLGMVLGAHGYPEAPACLDVAARLDRNEPCWPYLAGILVGSTRPDEAIPRIREALGRVKGSSTSDILVAEAAARLRLAALLLSTGDLEQAEELYSEIDRAGTWPAQSSVGLARIAIAREDLNRAFALLQRAKDRPEMRKTVRVLLAEVHRLKGDREQVGKLAREANDLPDDPAPADPWQDRMDQLQVGEFAQLKRAERLFHEEQYPQAITILEQTVREYPRSSAVWHVFGRTLLKANRQAQAEAAFRKALELAPNQASSAFYLGVAVYEQGEKIKAITHFETAVRLRPDHAMAWYNLAQCRREQGDRPAAIKAFQQTVHYKPDFVPAHVALARLLADMGQLAEARKQLEVVSQLAPADPEVVELQRQLADRK